MTDEHDVEEVLPFETSHILTGAEKKYYVGHLFHRIKEGDVDAEMVPYLLVLNSVPCICTTESCCGHGGEDGRKPYVTLRTALEFKELWSVVFPVLDDLNTPCEMSVFGDFERPRFSFCMENESWEETMDALSNAFLNQRYRNVV